MSTLRYNDIFDKAWASMRENLGLIVGLTFVYLLAIAAVHSLSVIGTILVSFFHSGYVICLLRLRDKKNVEFQDFFWAFMDFHRLLQQALLHILLTIMIVGGFILLVVPGIYISVASSLSTIYFVLRQQDAIESIKNSVRLVSGRWWFMAGLWFLIGLLNLAGILCFLVGVVVSVPMTVFILVATFEALEKNTEPFPGSPTSLSDLGGNRADDFSVHGQT